MTFGKKLAELRRAHGHTQEDLAEQLCVSRQSVGKWESDAAYPETDKIVCIAQLYNCSLDYLLKDEVTEQAPREKRAVFDPFTFRFERKSKRTVGGLPLWHVNIGWGQTATGIFAVGLVAKGFVSVGLVSMGLISLGVLALGLLALGTFALGALAFGAIALGLMAFGAIAVGLIAFGAVSIGLFSTGALAVGKYFAYGDHAYAAVAIGKTKAVGTVFQAVDPTTVDRITAAQMLDQIVPQWLAWGREIAKIVLRA